MPGVRLVPGVYYEEVQLPTRADLGTGVAGFVGYAARGPVNAPVMVTSWTEFEQRFGDPVAGAYLWHAVRGYFENGGQACFVARAADGNVSAMDALCSGLAALAGSPAIDLVAAPDVMRRAGPGVPVPPAGTQL